MMNTLSIKTLLLIFSVLLLSNPVFANLSMAGIDIPEKIILDKTTLQLNGTTFRKVSLFNVKVWLSALYLETLTTDSELILNSKSFKVIDLFALYDISASDSKKGWKLAIDQNCEPKCQSLDSEIQKFYSHIPEFKKNSHYRYIFSSTGIHIFLGDKEIFYSNDTEFSTLLLKTWIGKNPPSADVKKDLLKGSSKL